MISSDPGNMKAAFLIHVDVPNYTHVREARSASIRIVI
jgi:hypothetical protein